MRRVTAVGVLAALLAVSGCAAPVPFPGGDADADRLADGERGVVDGYAADDEFAFDADDGLAEPQLEAVASRAMARLELVRGLEFERDVDVEVIGREAYRDRRLRDEAPGDPVANELWRGAFVVGADADVDDALDEVYGDAVVGYYSDGAVVIVADDPDDVRLDRTTLVHELGHALQDQHGRLGNEATRLDARRAETAVTEGEAEYLSKLYDGRCATDWECVPDSEPAAAPDGGAVARTGGSFNAGLYRSIYLPYAEGPRFVASLREAGGWAAVDAAHDERPASTSQVIHPERYPDDDPVGVSVPDRSGDAWEPFAREDGGVRTETVGEGTLFATLWYNGVVDPDRPFGSDGEGGGAGGGDDRSPYTYAHPITEGWAGDAFVAYRDDDGRTGHVWELAWRSDADAAAFHDAYLDLLETHSAKPVDGEAGVYRIPDSDPFAGAYRASLEGDRVVIVGAPTVAALDAIREPPEGGTSTGLAPGAGAVAPETVADG